MYFLSLTEWQGDTYLHLMLGHCRQTLQKFIFPWLLLLGTVGSNSLFHIHKSTEHTSEFQGQIFELGVPILSPWLEK